MQQQQGGGSQSQYRLSTEIPHFAAPRTGQMLGGATVSTDNINNSAHHQQAEEASPISSRPPASSNFEELIVPVGHGSGGGNGGDDDVLGASDEMDRGGISGGNRWPRQETLALLKIRSEMDVTFRDASLKGPLWEEVSRKLAELGYTRNAKKCKEKFENVHKYYKRTKEGRAGRQDGKSYRFFSQLEALHGTTTTATPTSTYASPPAAATTTTNPLFVNPVSIGISNPMPVQIPPPSSSQSQAHQIMGGASQIGIISPPSISTTAATTTAATTSTPAVGPSLGISFSSDSYSTSSSASEDEEEDDEDDVELPVELGGSSSKYVPDSSMGRGQKRKRGGGGSGGVGGSGSRRLMGFLESLMKQVMQKQEAMQQRFLETIEKREKDRMIREEAWKRQEMTRLSREHELMAQERAIAASRDSAIISFLQKITGQTIQFPTTTPITTTFTVPIATPSPLPTPSATIQPPPPPPPQQQQQPHQQRQQTRHQLHQAQKAEEVTRHQQPPLLPPPPVSSEIVVAVPEQQVAPVVQQETSGGAGGGSGSYDPTSSRWPKTEVNALIQLRSEFEAKYQEAGPKGPLWEEISARMQRMGYKRNAKRCKEKWENINKYFKKVKESNKKRPEDAKTCPYFHQLDALYRKKSLAGSTSGAGSTSFGNQNLPEQPQQQQQQQIIALDPTITAAPPPQLLSAQATESASDNKVDNSTNLQATLFREGSSSAGGGPVKPEDIMKELIEQQQQQQQQQQQRKPSLMDDYDKVEELDSDNLDLDEDDEEEEEEESEEDTKMAYKIEFQRQNNAGGSASNRGGNGGAPSFVTMVQ